MLHISSTVVPAWSFHKSINYITTGGNSTQQQQHQHMLAYRVRTNSCFCFFSFYACLFFAFHCVQLPTLHATLCHEAAAAHRHRLRFNACLMVDIEGEKRNEKRLLLLLLLTSCCELAVSAERCTLIYDIWRRGRCQKQDVARAPLFHSFFDLQSQPVNALRRTSKSIKRRGGRGAGAGHITPIPHRISL